MRKPQPRRAAIVVDQPEPCSVCRYPFAPLGIGPPILKAQRWFCAPCYVLQPSTQAALAERCRDALDEGEM